MPQLAAEVGWSWTFAPALTPVVGSRAAQHLRRLPEASQPATERRRPLHPLPFAAMRLASTSLLIAAAATSAAAQQQFFLAPSLLAAAMSPLRIRVGDYDADGAPDLYIPQVFFPPQLLHNDGAGVFTNVGASLPLPQGAPQDAVFVDFDGDGDRDLLVGTGFSMQLFEYRGAGVWIDASANLPPNLPPFVNAVARDFDGDGDIDVACVTHPLIGGTNRMLVNQGNGTFTATLPFGNYGNVVLAADLDGDGDDDLVVAVNWPPRSLELWRNDGAMGFTDISANAPVLPNVLPVVGDVDGDGDVDIVAADWSGGCAVLKNSGGGVFAVQGMAPAIPGGTFSVELADVDMDGDLDLMRVDNGTQPAVHLDLNNGTGVFAAAPSRVSASPNGLAGALPFDVDRDGDLDVLLSVALTGVQVLVNRHRQLVAASGPQRGAPWTIEVWSQPGYGTTARAAWLAVGLGRLGSPLGVAPFGLLWLDASMPFVVVGGVVAPAATSASFVLPIPVGQALVGVVLHVQALVEESPGFMNARLTAPLSAAIQ